MQRPSRYYSCFHTFCSCVLSACSAAVHCCARNVSNLLMLHKQLHCPSSSCTVVMHLPATVGLINMMVTLPVKSALPGLAMAHMMTRVYSNIIVYRLQLMSARTCHGQEFLYCHCLVCWPTNQSLAANHSPPRATACNGILVDWLRMQFGKLSSRLKSGGSICFKSVWHADLLYKGVQPAGASACPPLTSSAAHI